MLPWLELDKLDANISVRNLPTRNFYVGDFTVVWVDATDKTLTMWFRPKYIHVMSIYDGWDNCRSNAYITENKVVTNYVQYGIDDEYSLWEWDLDTVRSIYIYRDGTRYRTYYTEILTDWVKFTYDDAWWAPPDIAVHIFAIW